MAEKKAPDPLWTVERIQAVIAKIYSEYEPHCERELDRMLARDVATVIAQIFQLGEAYEVSRRTDLDTRGDLARLRTPVTQRSALADPLKTTPSKP